MANNQQPQGGNSMAAMLGNMQPRRALPNMANYGAGMQAPMQAWGAGQQPQQGGLGAADPEQMTNVWRGPLPGQQPQANYGAGMQAPMQGGWAAGQPGGPGPSNMPGGAGYPAAGGPGLGGPVQAAPGAPAGMADIASMMGGAGGGPQKPMPSFGAPGGGAPGKGAAAQNPQLKNAIAGLRGGPPMGRPGMMGGVSGPYRRPQGMQPPNPAMRR